MSGSRDKKPSLGVKLLDFIHWRKKKKQGIVRVNFKVALDPSLPCYSGRIQDFRAGVLRNGPPKAFPRRGVWGILPRKMF